MLAAFRTFHDEEGVDVVTDSIPRISRVSKRGSLVGSPKETLSRRLSQGDSRRLSQGDSRVGPSQGDSRVGWRCPRQCQRFGSGAAQGSCPAAGVWRCSMQLPDPCFNRSTSEDRCDQSASIRRNTELILSRTDAVGYCSWCHLGQLAPHDSVWC